MFSVKAFVYLSWSKKLKQIKRPLSGTFLFKIFEVAFELKLVEELSSLLSFKCLIPKITPTINKIPK